MSELAIVNDIHEILGLLSQELPSIDRDNVIRLLDVGEYGVALETLCDQLCERDIVPAEPVYQKLMDVAFRLRIQENYWRAIPRPPAPGNTSGRRE